MKMPVQTRRNQQASPSSLSARGEVGTAPSGIAQRIADSAKQRAQARQIAQLRRLETSANPLEDALPEPSTFARRAAPNGLPAQLRSGIESLSGVDMSDVRIHRNSSKPAQLQALAYAQGSDIHLGPGQERHLPHEAWHVVQQKQGRVRPTQALRKGIAINDDAGLEHEADVMGAKALQMRPAPAQGPRGASAAGGGMQFRAAPSGIVQRTSVELKTVTTDTPVTVVSRLKNVGIDKVYLGVSTKVNYLYERVKFIKAIIHPGAGPDGVGQGTGCHVGSTAEIGNLGAIEAITLGYPGNVEYAGGHLVGSQFWTSHANSLLEENLVPMRQSINSSIYKILEAEVSNYLGIHGAQIGLEITPHYDAAQVVTLNQGGLQAFLQSRHMNTAGINFGQTFNLNAHVPDKITVKVITYVGSPDLGSRVLDDPASGGIEKSKTYDKADYVNNIGWDATHSRKKPKVTKGKWVPFKPIELKSARSRTYNFFQETV